MITPPDLIRSPTEGNTGRLSVSLFPLYTQAQLEALLAAQLTAAYTALGTAGTAAERDALASAFAYAQAYDEALVQSFDEASETRLDNLGTKKRDLGTKRNSLRQWAGSYRAQWERGLDTGDGAAPKVPPSAGGRVRLTG